MISVIVNGTSVTHSFSPSLQGCADRLPIFLSNRPALSVREESLFSRKGGYWTIGYQRHVAFLKATRGLHDLALLLRNPGREFHVCELVGQVIGSPLVLGKGGYAAGAWQDGLLSDVGPILDAQAKAEYKHRLDDLRRDLEEAERFNDPSSRRASPGGDGRPCRAARLGRRTRRTESKNRFRSGTRTLRSDQANQKLNQENR